MRKLLILLFFPLSALAAIGDPCPMGSECPPGEVCLAHEEGAYCTTRCPQEGCPEGYLCRSDTGVEICARGESPGAQPPAGMGEPCDEEIICAIEYFCATDGEERYCSRPCWGAGSCPEGFRCTGAGMTACARLRGLPGGGEPCAPETGCAEGLACIEAATRERPLCALPCTETAQCAMGMVCQNDHCIPAERALRPALGEPCRDDAAEPSLAGCAGDLVCYVEGRLVSYCTQGSCDGVNRCPAGFGCREVAPLVGACRRGVPDELIFTPPPTIDLSIPPPSADLGVSAPPGGGGSKGGGGSQETGCTQAPGVGGWWALALLALRRRRRSF